MAHSDPLTYHLDKLVQEIGANPSEITIIKMSPGATERHRELELINGEWTGDHPWIVIDDSDQSVYTMSSAQSLAKMIGMMASVQNEAFQLKLEKAIWQRFPIDFVDVWTVAMDKIRTLAKSRPESRIVNLDLDWLVAEIKNTHPNLFYHLDDLLGDSAGIP